MAAQHFDKFFKGLGISDAFSLINMIPLRMLDINPKQLSTQMVNFNPTELMEIDLNAYRADLIMELDHVILMFEFQSTHIYLDDKRRFNIYTAIKDRARFGDKPIYIIVFSTVEDTKVIDYKVNPVSSFKILVISLKDYNAGEIINNIEIKIKNNQKINQNELINLALSPLMTLDGTIAQHLEKTVQTLSKLKKSIKENSKFVFTLTWILVDKFIEDGETRQKLSNILSDNMRLMEEFGQSKYEAGEQKGEKRGIKKGEERGIKKGEKRGIKKGEKRGIVKARQEIAVNLLKEGLPLELISQVTDVSVERLERFSNNGK